MKLSLFKVQNFRSIWNSGWVSCQDITALAGVNEAGKSNLLKALWKLKPAFQVDNKIVHSDLPRDKFDEIMDSEELPVFISAKFTLDKNDIALLKKYFPQIKSFDTCIVSRTLSGKYIVEVPVNVPQEHLYKLHNFVVRIMPGFIYYSNYGNLDSNIYLPQMLSKFNKSGVNALSTAKRRTVKLLLMYMGITAEMLEKDLPLLSEKNTASKVSGAELHKLAETQDKYKQILEDAGKRLSEDFNKWWRQGSYKFEFSFDGDNLRIWVTDDKGNRAPLEERSVGMQWFLSFFLVFSLETQYFYTNTILLLDESGMTLHSLAQQDLVRFFEKLAEKNQLIYSTHSSFMLPTEHLNRTKVVYKDRDGHSVVTNELSVNPERSNEASLFPVHSAVGMELSRSILNGSAPVIVVNSCDQFYLNTIKNYVTGKGKVSLYNDMLFVSAGENGIDGTAQILSGGKQPPCVFLPSDEYGTHMREYLLKHSYKDYSRLIFRVGQFGQFITIEDTFPYQLFAEGAGNYLAKILGLEFEIDTALPFVQQVQDYAQANNIDLPGDFRDQVAKRVKMHIQNNATSIKIPRSTRKVWETMVKSLNIK